VLDLRRVPAAVSWCLEARPDRGVTLGGVGRPTLLLRRCDAPLERLREVIGDEDNVTLASIGDERFRWLTIEPGTGGVRVVEGGPVLHRAGWRLSAAAVTELVRDLSPDVVYASVRRTGPSAPGDRLRMAWGEDASHEEHLAPDAFPIQMLGPGYAGWVPDTEDWRATDLGDGRVLLEHVDPAAWFAEVTLEAAFRGETIPSVTLLDRARASFGPVLFVDPTKEERDRQQAWRMAHPEIRLTEEIVAKVHALPQTPHIRHWDVAFLMRDGRVIEDVELGFLGWVVTRVAGKREFSLDPDEIVDVLDRSTRQS